MFFSFVYPFFLRVKKDDKMKDGDSSKSIWGISQYFDFPHAFIYSRTIPQKKGLRERQKEHCNLPSYLKEQSLFIASWVILIYN